MPLLTTDLPSSVTIDELTRYLEDRLAPRVVIHGVLLEIYGLGVLLLGEKRGRGLYTQEEIEIARASGERLIDSQAGAEMARRLMGLQRERLTESQVLDQRARRVLHDDVLPRLHAAMLTLGAPGDESYTDTVEALADAHRQIADLLHEMPTVTAPVACCAPPAPWAPALPSSSV